MTKTIKINKEVHKELKLFTTKLDLNMEEVAAIAIVEQLKRCGHKFTTKKLPQLSDIEKAMK